MQDDDIDMLQRIASKEKIRYDELDLQWNNSEKNMIAGTTCYVALNLTAVLNDFETFREGLVEDKDFELHAAIELLNIVAHWKHWFRTRQAYHVVIVTFVRDGTVYEKYTKILDMFYEFTNFFPNVYFIPNIAGSRTTLHSHIVAAVIGYMKSISPTAKTKHSSIFVISSINSDRQLMFLFPTRIACTIYKGYGFSSTTFLTKEKQLIKLMKSEENYKNFRHKAELEYMNVFIGKYFNSTKLRNAKLDSIKIKYTHFKNVEKIAIINDFIENHYDPSQQLGICNQFLLYLQSMGEIDSLDGVNALISYESYFDYRFQNAGKLNEIIIPIFEAWKKKIKDYSIARQSENFNLLKNHMPYINWLI